MVQSGMPVLKLAGGAALSAFRLDKLNNLIGMRGLAGRVLFARYWHFVEVSRPPDAAESAVLDRLLDYGPPAPAIFPAGPTVLVTPRLGTISPWSSKATDLARLCGLDLVRRIERGTAFQLTALSNPAEAGSTRAGGMLTPPEIAPPLLGPSRPFCRSCTTG